MGPGMRSLDRLRISLPVFLLCAAWSILAQPARAAGEPHLFVVTWNLMRGSTAALDLDPPWAAAIDLEFIGTQAVVRHFFGNHYVVNGAAGEIQVIDPSTFDTTLTFSVGIGSNPQDIVLVDPVTAYVSRYDSTLLYKVDPTTGALLGTIDLGGFADNDGLPEMSRMALDRNHLFVQIQRLDRALTGNPVPPSYLAVIDVTTDQLVDVDPDGTKAGPPGIVLRGTNPSLRMHRDSRARRLFVGMPGVRLDVSGGIEEVDLDALRSLGFMFDEENSIGDLGAFVMVTPDLGYAVGHTDITESSHLFMFTREEGRVTNELYLTFDTIRSMAYDPATALLFFPDSGVLVPGIHVLDTLTNEGQVRAPVPTGLQPRDLIVARETTTGGVTDLRVTGIDPRTGGISISYHPACGASDHNFVWGRLQDVGTYQYSGRDCGIGATGSYDRFKPGGDSYFFIVTGMDAAGVEGSYGARDDWSERPTDLVPQACSSVQDLSFSCDSG